MLGGAFFCKNTLERKIYIILYIMKKIIIQVWNGNVLQSFTETCGT